jgi:organic hydroperoxide reductase OsmC/OhrA
MRFAARIHNAKGEHRVEVSAGKELASISIAPKPSGLGSSVSGGEMLMLALATCYCNDTYREASKMKLEVTAVDVECTADFNAEGAAATNITYAVRISARASEDQIRELAARVDSMAEIQNTVRAAIPVTLTQVEAITG